MNKVRRAQIRSRAKWIEDGEKSSAYFLRLEASRQTFNTISSLKNTAGKVVDDDKEILKVAEDFYTSLFKSKSCASENIQDYISHTTVYKILNNENY